jgi:hypothetical protein
LSYLSPAFWRVFHFKENTMMSAAPKAPPGIPLPIEVAAIWGAFLYEGLLAHVHDHRLFRIDPASKIDPGFSSKIDPG